MCQSERRRRSPAGPRGGVRRPLSTAPPQSVARPSVAGAAAATHHRGPTLAAPPTASSLGFARVAAGWALRAAQIQPHDAQLMGRLQQPRQRLARTVTSAHRPAPQRPLSIPRQFRGMQQQSCSVQPILLWALIGSRRCAEQGAAAGGGHRVKIKLGVVTKKSQSAPPIRAVHRTRVRVPPSITFVRIISHN